MPDNKRVGGKSGTESTVIIAGLQKLISVSVTSETT
jgi:hypothetical protein